MNNAQVLEKIARIIRHTVEAGDVAITRESTAQEVRGWDSLSHTLIIMNLEDAFGVQLPIERTIEMKTVGELSDLIEELTSDGRR